MKIGWITMEKNGNRPENSVGSSRIRATWVMKYWKEASEWMVGEDYDCLVFQKAVFLQMLEEFDGIKIFDCCDANFLHGDTMRYYDFCDAVTVSTKPLCDYIQKFLPGKPVIHVPDRLDLEEHKPVKKTHNDKVRTAVWFGYSHNFHYLAPALKFLKDRDIQLTVFSDTGIEGAEDFDVGWKKYDYPRLHESLIQYDVAVFPGEREKIDLEGKWKSNNKLTTCYALGLPVISHPDDFDGLAGKAARVKEAKSKLALARKDFDVKLSIKQYKGLIKKLQKKS